MHAFHCPGGTCSAIRLYVVGGDGNYAELRATDLPIDASGQAASYEFSAEPWLRGIDSGGLAAGVLEEGDTAGLLPGDVLLEINGLDLTTDVAADLLLNADAGTTLDLQVERDGRRFDASLTIEFADADRDPRENFVVYRDKAWGEALSGFLNGWLREGTHGEARTATLVAGEVMGDYSFRFETGRSSK